MIDFFRHQEGIIALYSVPSMEEEERKQEEAAMDSASYTTSCQ